MYWVQGSNQSELTVDKFRMHGSIKPHSHKVVIRWCLQLQIANVQKYLLDASHYFHWGYIAAEETSGLKP